MRIEQFHIVNLCDSASRRDPDRLHLNPEIGSGCEHPGQDARATPWVCAGASGRRRQSRYGDGAPALQSPYAVRPHNRPNAIWADSRASVIGGSKLGMRKNAPGEEARRRPPQAGRPHSPTSAIGIEQGEPEPKYADSRSAWRQAQ
jgi:hypothetical protein